MTHVTSISLFDSKLEHKCVGVCVCVCVCVCVPLSLFVAEGYGYRRRRVKRDLVYRRDAHEFFRVCASGEP